MLKMITILSIIISGSFGELSPWPAKVDYIDQKITHFNYPNDFPTFKNRYLYEDKWYKSGGPIFFYCGNEGDIMQFWNQTGLLFEIAPQFNALVVFGEHRYYGTSIPFKSSFEQPFIQFLSIEEAMGDFVDMLLVIQNKFNAKSLPIITFGGSYGGILAAYMRLHFPHLIAGAISSSAPFKWVSGEAPLHSFFESIKSNYLAVNALCVSEIQNAYSEISILAKKGREGLRDVSDTLGLCSPMETNADLDLMYRWTRNAFVMMSMANYPYETNFFESLPAFPVNVSCNRAIGQADSIHGLGAAISVFYNVTQVTCFDYKRQYVDCADITGCGLGDDSLAWNFQACTEMNLYDPSNKTLNDMFPSLPKSLADVNEYCYEKFGVRIANKQLLTRFGHSASFKQSSNIVFSNGDLDPWMGGGILENLSDSLIAITINGGAHHLDLRFSNKADPPSVVLARQREMEIIRSWIEKHRN